MWSKSKIFLICSLSLILFLFSSIGTAYAYNAVCGSFPSEGVYTQPALGDLCDAGQSGLVEMIPPTWNGHGWEWNCHSAVCEIDVDEDCIVYCNVAMKNGCGSSDGQEFSSAPSSGLCQSDATYVSGSTTYSACENGDAWNWSCTYGGSTVGSCTAHRSSSTCQVTGACGSADTKGFSSTSEINTDDERCQKGAFSSFTDHTSYWTWACNGSGGGGSDSCSANKVSCGSSHSTTRATAPASNLCVYGTESTPTLTSGTIWYWSCSNKPGVDAICYTYKTACGSSNGGTFSSPPSANLCTTNGGSASGVTTNPTTYTWTCTGADSSAVSCSATRASNGACGSADTYSYQNTGEIDTAEERCEAGTFSSFVDHTSYWTWECNGSGGNDSCLSNRVATGPYHNTIRKEVPSGASNLCTYGTPTVPVLNNDIWYWSCTTSKPKVDAIGYVYKTTCGADNGQTLPSTPTDLCKYGAASIVSGSGPWTWTCTGNDALAVSCSANTTQTTVNGECGTDDGKVLSSTPTNLCAAGSQSIVSGSGPWTWTCTGSGTGHSDDSCSANKISFNNPTSITGGENCLYCQYYIDYADNNTLKPGRATTTGSVPLDLIFTLTGTPSYTTYKIGIGTDSGTPSMETTDWLSFSGSSATFNGASVVRSGTDHKPTSNSFSITYGNGTNEKTYYWFVKLTGESAWRAAGSFNTPKKPFPIVKVAADKTTVTLGTNIQYCTSLPSLTANTDACYNVCWKGTGTPDLTSTNWKCSVCYDNTGAPTLCATGNQNEFSWSLPEDKGSYISASTGLPTTSTGRNAISNPIFRFTSSVSNLKPGLIIKGSECAGEGDTGTRTPMPTWREQGL